MYGFQLEASERKVSCRDLDISISKPSEHFFLMISFEHKYQKNLKKLEAMDNRKR